MFPSLLFFVKYFVLQSYRRRVFYVSWSFHVIFVKSQNTNTLNDFGRLLLVLNIYLTWLCCIYSNQKPERGRKKVCWKTFQWRRKTFCMTKYLFIFGFGISGYDKHNKMKILDKWRDHESCHVNKKS